jgi:hypothetical protein
MTVRGLMLTGFLIIFTTPSLGSSAQVSQKKKEVIHKRNTPHG